jgi:alkane 1-monooxygenase
MPVTAHATVLLLPLLAALGLWLGGGWTWILPLFVFGFIPTAELFIRGSKDNADGDEEAARRGTQSFNWLLYLTVLVQVVMVLALLWRVPDLTGMALVGAIIGGGILCGGLGISVAHELGHHPAARDRTLAKILLLTTLYQHFFIEHNRGHHHRVATFEDPATSRLGEGVYGFWWRSVVQGARSAWSLETRRLARKGRGPWTWDNEMVRFLVIQSGAVAAVGLVFGARSLGAWLVASLIGVLLLETVNYLEHYGLTREQSADGRYERVLPQHSWNSNHPLGRILLFEVTRHSDHHAHPARPYPLLRHFEASPMLPTGYPGMILLALCPPAFKWVMNRQLIAENARLGDLAA